jgi:Ca2+-binding RTX toxin-like protein
MMSKRMTILAAIVALMVAMFATAAYAKVITGTNGPDTLIGTANADEISGLGGADLIKGRGGGDTLNGGAEADTIKGSTGKDTINAGSGDDFQVNGDAGNDFIDLVDGQTGDFANCGDGDDTVKVDLILLPGLPGAPPEEDKDSFGFCEHVIKVEVPAQ